MHEPRDPMLDLLIRGAAVLDGTGAPARTADVAIAEGRIAGIGGSGATRARRVIDADGLVLAPGFIDMHSHADFTLPAHPGAVNSLAQGVTSEVIGNCGFSPAPLSPDPALAAGQRQASNSLWSGLDWGWSSFGSFLQRLDEARPAVNCLPLVGHGMLRLATLGGDDRRATPDELEAMARALDAALDEGAWGMSTGLVYPPGSFAATEEIVAVGRGLAGAGAIYASHIRNEGDGLLESVDEAIAIGRAIGCPVQVSHLKAAGRRNHGRVRDAVGRIRAARDAGQRVTCDVYPYTWGSTMLSQVLPPWLQDGGVDPMVERLGSAEVRARVAADVASGLPGWTSYVHSSGGWAGIRIAGVSDPALGRLQGRTVAELAQAEGRDPLELVMDTVIADRGATLMLTALMADDDVHEAYAFPGAAIGSDQLGVTGPDAFVHPRAYGTFARVIGPFVRDGLLELPEAVRRATGLPASILGLTDRGRIAPGLVADLVLFDPLALRDEATYDAPARTASGVEAVIVGGAPAVDGGEVVDARRGRVLDPTVSGLRPPRRSR